MREKIRTDIDLCDRETLTVRPYPLQQLHSAPQTLHLLCHVLHQLELSTCRHNSDMDLNLRWLTCCFNRKSVLGSHCGAEVGALASQYDDFPGLPAGLSVCSCVVLQ